MKKKVIAALILSLSLVGCGKTNEPIVQPEVELSNEPIVYELKSTDDIQHEEVVPEQTVPQQELQDYATDVYNPDIDVSGQVPEEIEGNVSSATRIVDDSGESSEEESSNVEEVSFMDIASKVTMAEEYIMTIQMGVPGMGLIIGQADDYQATGTESCFILETANGTFYKDSSGVKKVDVSGRSSVFSEDESEDETDSANMDMDVELITADDIDTLMDSDMDFESEGTKDINGNQCYVFLTKVPMDDGTDGSFDAELYIDTETYELCGMSIDMEQLVMTVMVQDYNDVAEELIASASGSISDEDASSAVEQSTMGSIMALMFGALAGAEMQ